MELKDMILSTLAELEEVQKEKPVKELVEKIQEPSTIPTPKEGYTSDDESPCISDEVQFCKALRERVLVLFEGFQSPNNKNIESKIDLTLNFLEYLLGVLDERLENLESHKK
ncbi:MAG: hypothetical protein IBX44_08225 [Sulfurospirillum sp.]|nr:hypothetical protein [Sulfurospirillum sp.]